MANHKKTKKPRKPQKHLPKVGTPADNAYRLKRSREDLLDFGLIKIPKGAARPIMAGIGLAVVLLVVLAFIAIT